MPALHSLPLNLTTWIEEHRHLLRPPVGNKPIWDDGEFIVMVVGGPNARKDFHYNPTPEFFYQIEGSIQVRLRIGEGFQTVDIHPGEVFLLPSTIPHSPQRGPDTIGLVIEQRRPAGAEDGLQWYCEACGHLLYAEHFVLTDIKTQFGPVFDRFFGSEALRTCARCGSVMQPPQA